MKVNLSLNKFVDLEIEGIYESSIENLPSSFIIHQIKQTKGDLLELISVVSEYSEFDQVLNDKILNEIENAK